MAIQWGSWDNHLRVGIDITQSPSSVTYLTDSVTLTIKYYVQVDNWSFSDTQTFETSGSGGSDSDSFSNNLSDNDYMEITAVRDTLVVNLTGSTQTKSFTGGLDGSTVYNGANPSKTRTWTVPAQPDPPYTVPTVPGNPLFSLITGLTAQVDWTAPTSNGGAAITNYQLQVATNAGFTTGLVTYNNGTSRVKSLTGLAVNTTYYVRVRAQNSVGYSSYSSTTSFTTLGLPAQVADPIFSAFTPTSVMVDWTEPANGGDPIISYDMEYSLNSGMTSPTLYTGNLDRNQLLSGLPVNTAGYVRVRAQNSYGYGPWSTVVAFNTTASSFVKVSGVWKPVVASWVKVGGVWKPVTATRVKVGGAWK